MSHNRTTQYSAPYRRNNLLSLHQYAASEQFPSLGMWDRARLDDLYIVRGTVGRNHPVRIMVVGVISSDKAHLQPHGNYDPNYMSVEAVGKKAKLQFVISSPADDPDFASDYAVAIERLKAIQDDVAGSPSRRDHFIEGGNLKMNFYLFSEKEHGTIDPEVDSRSDDVTSDQEEGEIVGSVSGNIKYEVASPYKYTWDTVSQTYDNNIMEVYGVDEKLVDYRLFPKSLISGTTVVVTFFLKHFGIRERGTSNIISDTFTATVVSVSILKEAEKKVRSTPSSTPVRRPLLVSQLPSRGTLKYAADTFSPVQTRMEPSTPTRSVGRHHGLVSLPGSPSATFFTTSDAGSSTVNTAISGESSVSVTDNISQNILDRIMPLFMERLREQYVLMPKRVVRSPSRRSSTSSTLSSTSAVSVRKRLTDEALDTISPPIVEVAEVRSDDEDLPPLVEPDYDMGHENRYVEESVSVPDTAIPVDPNTQAPVEREPDNISYEIINDIEVQDDAAGEDAKTAAAHTSRSKNVRSSHEKREGRRRRT